MINFPIKEIERRLLMDGSFPKISLTLPLTKSWPLSKKNSLTLKSLLKRAKAEMTEMEVAEEDQDLILAPALKYISKLNDPKKLSKSVQIFLSKGTTEILPIDRKLKSSLFVGQHFNLKPLIKLHTQQSFHVLRVDMKSVDIFKVKNGQIINIQLDDMPTSFYDYVRHFEFQKTFQSHSSGASSVRHGQGGKKSHIAAQKQEYCKAIENIVTRYMNRFRGDLVVCGPIDLVSTYIEFNHYAKCMPWPENYIDLEGKESLVAELVLKLNKRWGLKVEQKTNQEKQVFTAGDRVSDLDKVAKLAHEGRLKNLFVRTDKSVWGRYLPNKHRVILHPEKRTESEDLLNESAIAAMRNGANVYPMPENMKTKDIRAVAVPY